MTQRTLLISLLVSVALNCGLLGVIIGDRAMGRARAVADVAAQRIGENLPPNARPAMLQALRAKRFELLHAVRDFQNSREKVRKLAAEYPVKIDNLAATLAAMRDAISRAQIILHQAIVDGLASTGTTDSSQAPRVKSGN